MKPHVERTQILDIIEAKVARIEQRSDLPRVIVNLHGMYGLGKTSLLQQLFDYYKQDHVVISLNFDSVERSYSVYTRSGHEVLGLLQDVSLLHYLPEHIIFANGEEKSSVQEVSLVCQADIEELGETLKKKKPIILLLDNLDDLPYWKWLQERILKPILGQSIDHCPVLIVATSQSPLFWHFWELREQCRLEELQPFSREETGSFLQAYDKELWTETLYQMTDGYPLGLVDMLDLLKEEKADVPLELSQIPAQEYRHTLLEQITGQLPEKAKKNVNIEEFLKSIVELGSEFDLTSLRHQSNLPPGRVNNTVTLLNSRGFFEYNSTSHTYQLKPLIAHLYTGVQCAS
jgi:hypothetical protein